MSGVGAATDAKPGRIFWYSSFFSRDGDQEMKRSVGDGDPLLLLIP